MKTKDVFGRFLSAVLILFGFTMPVFAGVHGEIPNDGKIPSDLGVITYGGQATKVAVHTGAYDDNGKKQLVNFADIDILNMYDQSDALKLRYGGAGTYVYGDITTTGAPIITPMNVNTTNGTLGEAKPYNPKFINTGDIAGVENSAANTIKLPKGITKDDIVYARLYWFGHLYNDDHSELNSDNPYEEKNCDAKDKEEAAKNDKTCKRFPKVLTIKSIAGYQNVKLKVTDTTYDITKEVCQGTFAYNSSRGGENGNNQRYYMMYSCSTDVTDKIKDNFIDYSETINVAVGDIKANPKNAQNNSQSNQVYRLANAAAAGNLDSGYLDVGARLLPFGGWQLVVVYDKKMSSQQRLLADPSKIGASNSNEVEAYIRKYFKPKNVTLYDGFTSLEPESTSGAKPISTSYTMSGFFTPKTGDVQGKLFMGAMGANGGKSPNDGEGIYLGKTFDTIAKIPSNSFNKPNYFNGSHTWLEYKNDGKYELKGKDDYHQGFDLDELDISDRLENKQSELAVKIAISQNPDGTTNRAMVMFTGVSIDIYVPKLCYEEHIFDTAGWKKFHNDDGTRKAGVKPCLHGASGTDCVQDISQEGRPIASGETLYYMVKFQNQEGAEEEALKTWVKVGFNGETRYNKNTSAIDNKTGIGAIKNLDSADFVYIKDNQPGAYSTQKLRWESDGAGDVTDTVYKDRQFNTYINGELKFYVGDGAGAVLSGVGNTASVGGGTLAAGDSAFVEFNATTGLEYNYKSIAYYPGYSVKMAGGDEVPGPTGIMSKCVDVDQTVKLNLLEGLQTVNQNFENKGDKDDTNKQDDRLYTQIAEMPFNVKMIFRPNIFNMFKDQGCLEMAGDPPTLCVSYDEELAKKYPQLFKLNEHGKWVYDTSLTNEEDIFDGRLKKFDLTGKLYLNVIRTSDRGACHYLTKDAFKIPFKYGDSGWAINHEIMSVSSTDTAPETFHDYTNKTGSDLVMPMKPVTIGDAFDGVTFMFRYYPAGLVSMNIDLEDLAEDANKTFDELSLTDLSEYYVAKARKKLEEKYEVEGKCPVTDTDPLKEICDKIDKEINDLVVELKESKNFFGTEISEDGSFHVCGSDNFVIRPAYFQADESKLENYAKFVNLDAAGDITKGRVINENAGRLAGIPKHNEDVLYKVFSAKSINGNAVPNYHTIIGGDIQQQRYIPRESAFSRSNDRKPLYSGITDGNVTAVREAYFKEVKTYLKPFISNECREHIKTQTFANGSPYFKESQQLFGKGNSIVSIREATETYNGVSGGEIDWTKVKLSDTYEEAKKIGKNTNVVSKNNNVIYDGYNPKERKEISGKADVDNPVEILPYKIIWDKNANNLTADFTFKTKVGDFRVNDFNGATTSDGGEITSAKVSALDTKSAKRFSSADLVVEAVKDPSKKTENTAVLYTENLLVGGNTKIEDIKGKIFNYYNVGDVLINLVDNSWTDNQGDQTYMIKDGEVWGTKCIINSTSNVPDAKGKIGCDVGMKNNESLVLRYQAGLIKTGISRVVGNNDTNSTYVYYHTPDVETNTGFEVPGKKYNLAITGDTSSLAVADVTSVVYLHPYSVYTDVVATLFDGTLNEDNLYLYEQGTPKCGFATDTIYDGDISVDEDPSKSQYRLDGRKDTIGRKNYKVEKSYAPFGLVPNLSFEYNNPADKTLVDLNSDYHTEEQCKEDGKRVFSPTCFKVNYRYAKEGKANIVATRSPIIRYESASGTNIAKPFFKVPLVDDKEALSIYFDIKGRILPLQDKNAGFIGYSNKDLKETKFKILSRAFRNGKTENTLAYFNFDRMHKTPNMPMIVLNTDFKGKGEFIDNNYTIQPATFDKYFNQLGTAGEEKTDRRKVGDDNYPHEHVGNIVNEIKGDHNITAVTFVYGKVHDENNGEKDYEANLGQTINVPLKLSIYCGSNEGALPKNCTYIPEIVLKGDSILGTPDMNVTAMALSKTIFTEIAGQKNQLTGDNLIKNGFIEVKIADELSKNVKASRVTPDLEYGSRDHTKISIVENKDCTMNDNGSCNIEVKATELSSGYVRFKVQPWLIHTPAKQKNIMYVDEMDKTTGIPTYYNYVRVRFTNPGTWGGEGNARGKGGDNVGTFDLDGDDTTSVKKGNIDQNRRRRRVDW